MKKTLKPRALRRLTEREKAIVSTVYLGICQEFESKLFASENDETITYDALFWLYNRKWKKACHLLEAKLKLVEPDPEFFEKQYQPQIPLANAA